MPWKFWFIERPKAILCTLHHLTNDKLLLPVRGGVGVMPGAGVGFIQLGFLQQGLAGSISKRQEEGRLGNRLQLK